MRFDELKINEAPFDTFKDRGTASGGSVPHGGDVAKSGGANWRRAAAGKMPDQIRQDKIAKANAAHNQFKPGGRGAKRAREEFETVALSLNLVCDCVD